MIAWLRRFLPWRCAGCRRLLPPWAGSCRICQARFGGILFGFQRAVAAIGASKPPTAPCQCPRCFAKREADRLPS